MACLVLPVTVFAWPTGSQWVSLVDQAAWQTIRDITGDLSPYNADISSHGYYKQLTVGDRDSAALYTDGSSLYFRFLLSSNPLSYSTANMTWEIDSRISYVAQLDTNGDNQADWTVTVSKNNQLLLFNGLVQTQAIPFGPINLSGSTYIGSLGYLQVVDTGIAVLDRAGEPNGQNNLHYLEYRVPLSWLPGITARTFFRPVFGTSNNEQNINKDYMIGNSVDYEQVAATSLGGLGIWGAVYDDRDSLPASNGGIWFGNETLAITGFGWPSSKTLTVQIYSPDGTTLLWQGGVATSSTGRFAAVPTWKIPLTVGPGLYRINVLHPTTAVSYWYDTFEITAPYVQVTKTVAPTTALPGDQVTYTIAVTNSGNLAAALGDITDTLPPGFTYVAGTSSGLTGNNPQIAGQNLLWLGSWSIPVATVRTITFKAKVPKIAGEHKNQVSASGLNFGPSNSGPTAPVLVKTPALSIFKTVNKTTAAPGEEIIYTISFRNQGGAAAQTLGLVDTIPTHATYVPASLRIGGAASTYASAAAKTDAPADDGAEFTGGSVIFTVGPIAADDLVNGAGNDEGKCYFKVTVN